MNMKFIKRLLEEVEAGSLETGEAMKKLRHLGYEDLGFAKVDHHRSLRKGFPEVIYCPGKTDEQIVAIAGRIAAHESNLLATRAGEDTYHKVKREIPEIEYNETARSIFLFHDKEDYGVGSVLVISAGTADIPVAEEAALTCQLMGNSVDKLYDVGVAGIHRLFDNKDKIDKATVLIVVAGMEGALASVVGGLVDKPVIAVPTSVGYGANLGGMAPLLTMLNSCASGVTVVNIDNGFGAGCAASLINRVGK